MQEPFFELTSHLTTGLSENEVLLCNLRGEASDFVRLNHNRIRQAGSVHRQYLELQLIEGGRQVTGGGDLTGNRTRDAEMAQDLLGRLRKRLHQFPKDPYLSYPTSPTSSERFVGGDLPRPDETVAGLVAAAQGLDLVGIWASGDSWRGFASSLGHRHWHASKSFNLDWSCYLEKDKALKGRLGGLSWDPAMLTEKLGETRRGFGVMARPSQTIEPGRYRAYMAPEAVQELMDVLAWGGFDLKSHRTSQTPLLRMVRGERQLDPRVSIREDHARGLVPGFTPEGFEKPERVPLICGGTYRDCLVTSRSGKEYGVSVNAGSDYPESLALDAGEIPRADILTRLGTGLYIGNLWYLNFSDRTECRVTGMTRFGTFWVENGELIAPIEVMRFDDSLYHLLGDRLEGLTRERELILSAETYGERSTSSCLLPGVLVSEINLTL